MGIAWSSRAFGRHAGIESLDGDLGKAFIAASASRGDYIDADAPVSVNIIDRLNAEAYL